MIRRMKLSEIPQCVCVIRSAFSTVAAEYNITPGNAPHFTAFATSAESLQWQYQNENRPMFVYYEDEKIIGYYSLLMKDNKECELNNLSVLPEYRHKGIGAEMLRHAFSQVKAMGHTTIRIGIVEENKILRTWYESFGFVHTGIQKFDFFPFTCGYMEINIP